MTLSNQARIFIGFMAACALATLGYALRWGAAAPSVKFWILLAVAVLTARLKVKLPGMTGNMAVSLPFLIIAVNQLSMWEALLVALPACVAQSWPKNGGKPKLVQMGFNMSAMAVAVGVSSVCSGYYPVLAALGFFLGQSLPMAGILSLTEGGNVAHVWARIAHYSFPFYVLSAGISSIAQASSEQFAWQAPLLIAPVLVAVYRSYESYFNTPRLTTSRG